MRDLANGVSQASVVSALFSFTKHESICMQMEMESSENELQEGADAESGFSMAFDIHHFANHLHQLSKGISLSSVVGESEVNKHRSMEIHRLNVD